MNWHCMSQSPQTGQVYFNTPLGLIRIAEIAELCLNPLKRVKFISITSITAILIATVTCLNPLKRVKFISIAAGMLIEYHITEKSLNPLKRVKFISILSTYRRYKRVWFVCLNPLKRVKFISMHPRKKQLVLLSGIVSIPSNGSSLFQFDALLSKTGVLNPVSIPSNGSSLFQLRVQKQIRKTLNNRMSQSPQTGQVYFNPIPSLH